MGDARVAAEARVALHPVAGLPAPACLVSGRPLGGDALRPLKSAKLFAGAGQINAALAPLRYRTCNLQDRVKLPRLTLRSRWTRERKIDDFTFFTHLSRGGSHSVVSLAYGAARSQPALPALRRALSSAVYRGAQGLRQVRACERRARERNGETESERAGERERARARRG